MVYRKMISIHSEDRDIIKYPNSAEFEINLPQDLTNVVSATLQSWSFPSNSYNFSKEYNNVYLKFQINEPYDPVDNLPDTSGNIPIQDFYNLQYAIFRALSFNKYNFFEIAIEDGFYDQYTLATELTNQMNNIVTEYIINYFLTNPENIPDLSGNYNYYYENFVTNGGYSEFIMVYNDINLKLWFGNKSSGFLILCNGDTYLNCGKNKLPELNSDLPYYLGFTKDSYQSVETVNGYSRFFYIDTSTGKYNGGYWLMANPKLTNCKSYVIEPPNKLNLLKNPYIYMEIDTMNNIDETSPYDTNYYTSHTNNTNSRVNSAFVKVPLLGLPFSQWYDANSSSYKVWNPPAERINKINVKLRYHNGMLVDFGNNSFSFTLEFLIYIPQISKKYTLYTP